MCAKTYIDTTYTGTHIKTQISMEVLPSALFAFPCFLTFTEALTVVNTQWPAHLLVSQCFERATPFTTMTPIAPSVQSWLNRGVKVGEHSERETVATHNRTQVRINKAHTNQVTNQTSSSLHHHGDLIHILCAITA